MGWTPSLLIRLGCDTANERQSTSRALEVDEAKRRTAELRPFTDTPLYGGRLIVATTMQRLPAIDRAADRLLDSRPGCDGSSFVPASNTTTRSPPVKRWRSTLTASLLGRPTRPSLAIDTPPSSRFRYGVVPTTRLSPTTSTGPVAAGARAAGASAAAATAIRPSSSRRRTAAVVALPEEPVAAHGPHHGPGGDARTRAVEVDSVGLAHHYPVRLALDRALEVPARVKIRPTSSSRTPFPLSLRAAISRARFTRR